MDAPIYYTLDAQMVAVDVLLVFFVIMLIIVFSVLMQCSNYAARCAAAPFVVFAAPLSFLKQTALSDDLSTCATEFFEPSVRLSGKFRTLVLRDGSNISSQFETLIDESEEIRTSDVLLFDDLLDIHGSTNWFNSYYTSSKHWMSFEPTNCDNYKECSYMTNMTFTITTNSNVNNSQAMCCTGKETCFENKEMSYLLVQTVEELHSSGDIVPALRCDGYLSCSHSVDVFEIEMDANVSLLFANGVDVNVYFSGWLAGYNSSIIFAYGANSLNRISDVFCGVFSVWYGKHSICKLCLLLRQ